MSERIYSRPYPRSDCIEYSHTLQGGCYMCCEDCNRVEHRCYFCGADLTHDSYETHYDHKAQQNRRSRHWLSDCRPDLVEHEIGDKCTWPWRTDGPTCYAYSSGYPHAEENWGTEHKHFTKDGPMT